jgi:hypothetical protein
VVGGFEGSAPFQFLPKIRIVPGDDEPIGTPQFQTFQDEAATTIGVQINKRGGVIQKGYASGSPETGLHEFVEDTLPGCYSVVNTWLPGTDPWAVGVRLSVGASILSVDSDAELLVTVEDLVVKTRDLGAALADTTTVFTLPLPQGGGEVLSSVERAVSNGAHIAVAYNTTGGATSPEGYLAVFDRDTGAQIGASIPHGVAVTDCAIDHARAYVVGAAGTGGFTFRATTLTIGTEITPMRFAHGATLRSVFSDGRQIYVGGDVGTGTFTLRALDFSSPVTVNWNVAAEIPQAKQCIYSDGEFVFVVGDTGGSGVFSVYSTEGDGTGPPAVGVQLDTTIVTANSLGALTASERAVFFNDTTTDEIYRLRREFMPSSLVPQIYDRSTFTAAINGMYYDGATLWVGNVAIGGVTLHSAVPHNSPQMWRRVAATDVHLPMRQLAIPVYGL